MPEIPKGIIKNIGDDLGKNLARWRSGYTKPAKLLGITALSTALVMDNPQDTQAMPPGVFRKIGKKLTYETLSSANKALEGRELEGKIITKVLKGRGDWRKILFHDDTEMTVKKQYINDLCRAIGTKKYINKFGQEEGGNKTLQAINSLKYHYKRAHAVPRTYTRELHRLYLTRAAEMSKELPPDTAFVTYRGKFFTMPKEYAEHLEDLGYVKINRTKRDIQSTKPKRIINKRNKKNKTNLQKGRK